MTGIKKSGWGEFRIGMIYLWEHSSAMPLVILSGVFAFLLGIFVVVFVGYAMKTLGLQTAGVGYLVAAGGIGAGAGMLRGRKGTAFPGINRSLRLPERAAITRPRAA